MFRTQTLFAHRISKVPHNFFSLVSQDKRHIFLANNSLLYAVNQVLPNFSGSFPPYVIVAPFWLDKAHSDFDTNDWGQSILGFPPAFNEVFFKLYPNFPPDKFLSWLQVKETRNSQVENLKLLHKQGKIVLLDFRDQSVAAYEREKLFKMTNQYEVMSLFVDGASSPVFSESLNNLGQVFNYFSVPRPLPPEVVDVGFQLRPHTSLYHNSIAMAPSSIMVYGAGLSVVWLAKHFPNSLVWCIKKDDRELPQIPSNSDVSYADIKMIKLQDLMMDINDPKVAWVKLSGSEELLKFRISEEVFTARGYEPYTNLTAALPREKVRLYTEFNGMPDVDWIAPQNIPVGSLTHRLSVFFYQARRYNLLAETPYNLQYYIAGVTPTILQKRLLEQNVVIDDHFFVKLKELIQTLANPLESEGKEMELYCNAFSNAGSTISSDQRERFKQVITEMQQEIKGELSNKELSPDDEGSNSPRF